jgi:uncharacterized protein
MPDQAAAAVQRIAPNERIVNLDVLRGIAILAILVMNIPYMGGYAAPGLSDPRLVSWTQADQWTYRFVGAYLDGTQRGLLELLFGAGIMIMSRAAMRPDGPVAVADLHYRRNLLLIALGIFQALVLFWPGDILFPYGLTAIFVFPFRTLRPRLKVLIAVLVLAFSLTPTVIRYQERVDLQTKATTAAAKLAAHKPVTKDEQEKLDAWNEKVAAAAPVAQNPKKREEIATQNKARATLAAYSKSTRDTWLELTFGSDSWWIFAEIFGTMLLGAALFEWGVLQGRLGAPAYLGMALVGYAIGVPLRWLAQNEVLTFTPIPKVGWMTWDVARIALALGHVGLINLALKARLGGRLLSPFQATGKMPLTTYLGASLIGMVILFPGFGFGLFGKYGWAGLETIAVIIMAGQLVFANLWLMAFDSGPLEWVWKSLAYGKAQPFRKAIGPKGALAAAE